MDIKLNGRIFLKIGEVTALTGLHIGGRDAGLEIGGIDKIVIRNPLNLEPYIPGSSLRGKMRSQTEKVLGRPQNKDIGQVTIHTCQKEADYLANGGCVVCHVYGVPGEMIFSGPTRLLVRDVPLDLKSENGKKAWEKAKPELPYAEIKTEVAIDRVTSQATPRTLERVPAGAIFGPAELVFNLYDKADVDRLKFVIEALQLVEDDYLGGAGSRGSGKVKFGQIEVSARSGQDYSQPISYKTFGTVQELMNDFPALKAWIQGAVPVAR
jgi:CRISPR-associated protein Csm3